MTPVASGELRRGRVTWVLNPPPVGAVCELCHRAPATVTITFHEDGTEPLVVRKCSMCAL